jgi:hypothetical protein
MHASSSELGAVPLLQLLPVNQLPPAVFVQESVKPLARAEEGAKTESPMIAPIAKTIRSVRFVAGT